MDATDKTAYVTLIGSEDRSQLVAEQLARWGTGRSLRTKPLED
jgi:xanthine/CO dehydrogenase XdhC/CoxF family maturation factor